MMKRRQFSAALKIGRVGRLSGRRRRKVIGAVLVVSIGYYLLGVMVFPELLVPVGCSGTFGTPTVAEIPNAELNISYESDTETITVEHVGGAVLYDNWTDQVTVTIESSRETQRFNWTEIGGAYPIREGDSVHLEHIPVQRPRGKEDNPRYLDRTDARTQISSILSWGESPVNRVGDYWPQ